MGLMASADSTTIEHHGSDGLEDALTAQIDCRFSADEGSTPFAAATAASAARLCFAHPRHSRHSHSQAPPLGAGPRSRSGAVASGAVASAASAAFVLLSSPRSRRSRPPCGPCPCGAVASGAVASAASAAFLLRPSPPRSRPPCGPSCHLLRSTADACPWSGKTCPGRCRSSGSPGPGDPRARAPQSPPEPPSPPSPSGSSERSGPLPRTGRARPRDRRMRPCPETCRARGKQDERAFLRRSLLKGLSREEANKPEREISVRAALKLLLSEEPPPKKIIEEKEKDLGLAW